MESTPFTPPEALVPSERSLVPNYASFYGESLLPPSDEGQHLTSEGFATQFPVRHAIWNVLQRNLNGNPVEMSTTNPDIVQRLRMTLHLLNQFDRYAIAHHTKPDFFNRKDTKLKPKQFDVFADIHETLEKGVMEGTIEAPTGFGKTVLFNQVVAAADIPTLIVVPSQKLVKQTYEQFQKRTPNISAGRVYAGSKEYGKQVTITTYASLVADEGKLIHPEGIQMVILDEVHEGTSKKRVEKIEAIEGFKNAVMLGFSATPVEIRDPRYKEAKVTRMTRNKIHEIGIQEAVEEGYLSSLSCVVVRTKADLSDVRIASDGDYDEKQLDAKINNEVMNKSAAEFFLKAKEQDVLKQREQRKRNIRPLTTALFATTIAHAQELARRLEDQGVKAAAVWGNQSPKEREEILRKWETGEIEVVCSKNLLIQGIDVPSIRMIMNVAPTASKIVELQRTGRGLRIDPNNLDKHTIVVDFVYEHETESGETISKSDQVIYPEIIGGANLYRKNLDPRQAKSYESEKGIEIDVEGVEVISDPNKVMEITKKMEAERDKTRVKFAPEGWGPITNLANITGKSVDWIEKRLPQILEGVRKEQEIEGLGMQELSGIFMGKTGRETTYYAPNIGKKLKDLLDALDPPLNWMPIGNSRMSYSITDSVNKSGNWVSKRMPKVISELIKEQENLPLEQRQELFKEYMGRNDKPITYYSPIVIERLRKLAEQHELAPPGWVTVGRNLETKDTLINIVRKSHNWLSSRLDQIFSELKRENPKLDLSEYYGEYIVPGGQSAVYYSPLVIEKLKNLAADYTDPPSGWLPIGQITQKDSLSNLLKKNASWFDKRVTMIINSIEEKMGNLSGESEPLYGEYLVHGKKVVMHYSPIVIERLRKLAEQHELAPPGWIAMGSKEPGTLTGVLKRSKDWIKEKLPEIIEELKREQERYSVDEQESLFGEYLNKGKQIVTFYNPIILERLLSAPEHSYPPSGWLTIGNGKGQLSGISGTIGRVPSWINRRLPSILESLKDQGDTSSLTQQYLDSGGHLRTFYSPKVINSLKRLRSEEPEFVPDGWMAVGIVGSPNTLSDVIGRTPRWVNKYLPQVLEEIQKEWNEKGIPEGERPKLTDEFLGKMGRPATYYSPLVIERLRELLQKEK